MSNDLCSDLRWLPDPCAHRPAYCCDNSVAQNSDIHVDISKLRPMVPSALRDRRKVHAVNQCLNSERRRRELAVSASRARKEAAKRAAVALQEAKYSQQGNNGMVPPLPAVGSRVAASYVLVKGRRKITPPLDFTRVLKQENPSLASAVRHDTKNQNLPPGQWIKEADANGNAFAAVEARGARNARHESRAVGTIAPTPVGLLARDFQRFLDDQRRSSKQEDKLFFSKIYNTYKS